MSSIALVLSAFSLVAAAQDGWDGHGFKPAGDDGDLEDLLTTWRPEEQVKGAFGASFLFEYAETPVVLYERNLATDAISETVLLDDVFALNLQAQGALNTRMAFAASMPLYLSTSSEGEAQGAGLGDIRVALPTTAYQTSNDSTRLLLGILPTVDLPSGDPTRFTGGGMFAIGALGTASYGTDRVLVSGNLGVETIPRVDWENVRGGFRGVGALGGSWLASDRVAVRLEAISRPKLVPGTVPGTESPSEALGSVRMRSPSGWTWTLGGAGGISPGWSAATYRAFAGVGYHRGKDAPVDTDGDGLVDRVDACPTEPETKNGYQDEEGCPDQLGTLTVTVVDPEGKPVPNSVIVLGGVERGTTDAQGRLVVKDLIPGTTAEGAVDVTRETALGDEAFAPPAIAAGDQAVQVQLDWLPGAVRVVTKSNLGAIVDSDVSFRGAKPIPASPLGPDGEALFVLDPGAWTLLVSAESFGIERRKVEILPDQQALVVIEVTLSPAVVATTKEEVVILQAVEFDFDKAVVKADSLPLLREVANNLLAYEEVKQVEVQGHTDSKGSDSYNKKLAQARVDAVVAILVENGVQKERLSAVGYGEACPIADNTSESGRASNRRVQFIVADPAPAGGIPCHKGIPARRADPTTVRRTVTETVVPAVAPPGVAPAAPAPAPADAPKPE
jgi:outer membrane protein OmpA-like peptidoglycan-associated protein